MLARAVAASSITVTKASSPLVRESFRPCRSVGQTAITLVDGAASRRFFSLQAFGFDSGYELAAPDRSKLGVLLETSWTLAQEIGEAKAQIGAGYEISSGCWRAV